MEEGRRDGGSVEKGRREGGSVEEGRQGGESMNGAWLRCGENVEKACGPASTDADAGTGERRGPEYAISSYFIAGEWLAH